MSLRPSPSLTCRCALCPRSHVAALLALAHILLRSSPSLTCRCASRPRSHVAALLALGHMSLHSSPSLTCPALFALAHMTLQISVMEDDDYADPVPGGEQSYKLPEEWWVWIEGGWGEGAHLPLLRRRRALRDACHGGGPGTCCHVGEGAAVTVVDAPSSRPPHRYPQRHPGIHRGMRGVAGAQSRCLYAAASPHGHGRATIDQQLSWSTPTRCASATSTNSGSSLRHFSHGLLYTTNKQ